MVVAPALLNLARLQASIGEFRARTWCSCADGKPLACTARPRANYNRALISSLFLSPSPFPRLKNYLLQCQESLLRYLNLVPQ